MALLHLSVVVLTFAAIGVSGYKWDALRVKYAIISGFLKMPLTVDELEQEDPREFVKAGHDNELNVDVYSHPDDPRFFLLFDKYGNIAGVRIGYIKSDVAREAEERNLEFPYPYDNIPLFNSGNFWNTDIWYTSFLFVNPEKLKEGGRQLINGDIAEGVFVKLNGNWLEIARNECDIEKQGFVKKLCIVGMGQHYYYNMTPDAQCESLQPVFALYDGGELQGFGVLAFGSYSNKEGGRNWFENVPRVGGEAVIPNAPQCAYDWLYNFDVTSLHIYLRNFARWTSCAGKKNRCTKQI